MDALALRLAPRLALGLAVVAAISAVALRASADDATREQAKAAYDRGLDAHKHGEMARAAREFAAADALAPSPQALQAALDAAIDADDVALGAELLERAKREPPTPGLASSITAATMKFNARAGRLRVVCPAQAACSAKVDDSPVGVGRALWVPVGARTVTVQVDGRPALSKTVEIGAETPLEVSPQGRELATRPGTFTSEPAGSGGPTTRGTYRTPREGLSPVVFYAGAGITVALAGFTTYLMIHTSSLHGEFDDKGCTRVTSKECTDLSSSGKSAQTAANVGLVFTAIAALATAAIGVGFTNWRGTKSASHDPFVLRF